VVKVIWCKAALPRQMDGSVVFGRWRQCALPWWHIGATWGIQLNLCFLRPTQVHNPKFQTANRSFQPFLHSSRKESSGMPGHIRSSGNCLFTWGIWTLSDTWFLWPTRVLSPNGISITSAVFAGLTSVTNRPTDHATRSVTIGRIYIRSTGDTA